MYNCDMFHDHHDINMPPIYIFLPSSSPPPSTHLPNYQSLNMAKLAIFAFLALFALAHVATAFRTTVTTTVEEDVENPGLGRPRCPEKMRMQQQLSHCQMHLKQKCRSRSLLSMSVNPGREEEEEEEREQYLDECCQQLRNINEQCRCEGLQQVVRQMVKEEVEQQKEQEEVRRMEHTLFREASEIPSRCNVGPRRCSFSKPGRW